MSKLIEILQHYKNNLSLGLDDFTSITFGKMENQWLQIASNSLNLSYPLSGRMPIEALKQSNVEIPNGIKVQDWQDSMFLTLDYSECEIDQIEKFLLDYILNLFPDAEPQENWQYEN